MVALYDEEQILKTHIASEKKESEIKGVVKSYQFLGKTITEAVEAIKSLFNLSSTPSPALVNIELISCTLEISNLLMNSYESNLE